MTEPEFKYINGMCDLAIAHLITVKQMAWERFFGMSNETIIEEAEDLIRPTNEQHPRHPDDR